jgi:nicotinate-nucleotide pyrophosphorylase (carboxylating)
MNEPDRRPRGAHPAVHPPLGVVRDAVARALAEDLVPLGDVTSALLPPEAVAEAAFVVRAPGVLAGRLCADEAFRQVDPSVVVTWSADDGDRVAPGQEVGRARGSLSSVLTAERTALNFLGHLSGIATMTRRFADALAGTGLALWDTRKTTPGLRTLEKAAVRAGGGANHRGNLSDWILLKDNHLTVLGIDEAVRRARAQWPARTVHVECDRYEQFVEALDAGADAVLLDNMDPAEVRRCVEAADAAAGGNRRCLIEISGGITLETVRSFAETGADRVSTGQITNSAPVLDIGLDIATDLPA